MHEHYFKLYRTIIGARIVCRSDRKNIVSRLDRAHIINTSKQHYRYRNRISPVTFIAVVYKHLKKTKIVSKINRTNFFKFSLLKPVKYLQFKITPNLKYSTRYAPCPTPHVHYMIYTTVKT